MSSAALRSFRRGELTPRLHARADTSVYAEGLQTARNVVVLTMGGVQSRPGTEYLGASKSNGQAYLIPLVRDVGQEYLIEAGNLYFRFWLNGVQVTVGTPSAWLTATAYTAGTSVENDGTNFICILSHTSGALDDEPGVGAVTATYWYPLTSNILELPTPYTLAQVPFVQWADDGTTLRYFSHPSYPMRELIRVSATAWTFLVSTFDASDPVTAPTNLVVTGASGSDANFTRYKVTALSGLLESEPSNIDGWNKRPGPADVGNQTPITLGWDAVSGATGYNVYISLSAGSGAPGGTFHFRAQVSTNAFYDDTVITHLGGPTPPGTDLALTDFTASTKYPGVLGVHQQRLLISGQTLNPDTVYASRTGNFDNFFPHVPIQDDDAMSWRQVASRVNRIKYVAEIEERLVIFSEHTEGIARGDVDGILRPGEVNPTTLSHNGIGDLPPLAVNTSLLYVQARGRKVRDLLPSQGIGDDLTLTAEHLTRRKDVVSWCYQPTPEPIIWLVLDDGSMCSITYERSSGTVGWARHDTDGLYESVACVPYSGRDAVHAFIKRTINAGTVRYLERFTDRSAAWPDTVCVDSAVVAVEA